MKVYAITQDYEIPYAYFSTLEKAESCIANESWAKGCYVEEIEVM